MIKLKKNRQLPHSSVKARNHCYGFSLTELVLAIAIIAIVSAVAAPIFINSWLPNIRLKSAGRDLYSTMQDAKINAIRQNKEWAIVFDTSNNRYYLCDDDGTDNNWGGVNDHVGTGDNNIVTTVTLSDYRNGVQFGTGDVPAGKSATTPPGAFPVDNISYANNLVTFNPRGTGKSGYVYLENNKGSAVVLGTLTSGVIRYLRWLGSWK